MIKQYTYFLLLIIIIIFSSCNKNNTSNQIVINKTNDNKELNVIVLLGDGMGIPQITASWHEKQFLNLQRFPYSGLVLTHAANKFVTESAAGNTALMSGVKTNYGYVGVDPTGNRLQSIYEYVKRNNYLTGLISTSFMTDATLAVMYSHRLSRLEYEEIALDFYHHYPDLAIAGGRDHFDKREDQTNLLDSLQNQGVDIFSTIAEMNNIEHLPTLGLMADMRPPYILNGREPFLYEGSRKALSLFQDRPFFLFIEGGQIDYAGHDNDIEKQVSETLEFDRVAGMALDYAENSDNTLVLVIADHECGGLSLLQGNGMEYLAHYAADEHSGSMVAVFAYGPGAENFSGIMDNTEIYHRLKTLIDTQLIN